MQWICRAALLAACCGLASCSKQDATPRNVVQPDAAATPAVPVIPVVALPGNGTPETYHANDAFKAIDTIVSNLTVASTQEQYDAALLKALGQLADKKFADALATLETARCPARQRTDPGRDRARQELTGPAGRRRQDRARHPRRTQRRPGR